MLRSHHLLASRQAVITVYVPRATFCVVLVTKIVIMNGSCLYDQGVRIRVINAFTDRPFTGNSASVCLLDADIWPDECWMQQIAAEMDFGGDTFSPFGTTPELKDARCNTFVSGVRGTLLR